MRTYYPTLIRPSQSDVIEWALPRGITNLSTDTDDWHAWVYRKDNDYFDYVLCLNTTDRRIALRCDNAGYPGGPFVSVPLDDGPEDEELITKLIEAPATIGAIEAGLAPLTDEQWAELHKLFHGDPIQGFQLISNEIEFETDELCTDALIVFKHQGNFLLMEDNVNDPSEIQYATISEAPQEFSITSFDALLDTMGCSEETIEQLPHVTKVDLIDLSDQIVAHTPVEPKPSSITIEQINQISRYFTAGTGTSTPLPPFPALLLDGGAYDVTGSYTVSTNTVQLVAEPPKPSVTPVGRVVDLAAARRIATEYGRPDLEQGVLYHTTGWWRWTGDFGEEKSQIALVAYCPSTDDWVSFFCDDNGVAQLLWGTHSSQDTAQASLTKAVRL